MSEQLKQHTDESLKLREKIKANYEIINNLSDEELKIPAVQKMVQKLEQDTFALQREAITADSVSNVSEKSISSGELAVKDMKELRVAISESNNSNLVRVENPDTSEIVTYTEGTFTSGDLEEVKTKGLQVLTLFKSNGFTSESLPEDVKVAVSTLQLCDSLGFNKFQYEIQNYVGGRTGEAKLIKQQEINKKYFDRLNDTKFAIATLKHYLNSKDIKSPEQNTSNGIIHPENIEAITTEEFRQIKVDAQKLLEELQLKLDKSQNSSESVKLNNIILELSKMLSSVQDNGNGLTRGLQEIKNIETKIEELKSKRFVIGKANKLKGLESSLNVWVSSQSTDQERVKNAYLKISELVKIGSNILQK